MMLASPASDTGSNHVCALGGAGRKKGLRSLEESRGGARRKQAAGLGMGTGSWQRGHLSTGDSGHTSGLGFIGKSKDRPQPSMGGWDWKIK